MTVTCPSCAQTTIQVLSLVLVISQTSWSENATALNPYAYETSLINNATNAQLAVSGLTENIYINGVLYTTLQTDSNGNGLFIWTPQASGQYMIKAVFPGQNFYTNSSTTIMLSVARRNVVLAANNSPQSPSINQQVTWNVYAQDMVSSSFITSLPISLFINSVNTTTVNSDSAGNAVFRPPTSTFGSKGLYNVTFVSGTTRVYNSATYYDPLMVYLDTRLTVQAGTMALGLQNTITVTLADQNGNPLSNKIIRVEIDGAFYQNATTNPSGQAQFNWIPKSTGSHAIVARFLAAGTSDTGFNPSTSTLSVTISPLTTTNISSTLGGTQSVNLISAQGSPQQASPSVSVSFPAVGSVAMSIQWGSLNISGTVGESNDFGLACVAKVLGTCVLVVPYWKAHINLNIPNYGWLSVVDNVLSLDQPSISSSIPCLGTINFASPAFGAGVTTGALMELPLIAILFASVFEPGAAEGAALVWDAAMIWGVPLLLGLAPQMYGSKSDRFNYAAGFLLTLLATSGETVATVLGILIQKGVLAASPDVKILVLLGAIYGLLMSALFTIAYCYA